MNIPIIAAHYILWPILWLIVSTYFDAPFFQPLNLCDIEHVCSVVVTKEDQISQKVSINLKDPEKEVMPIAGFLFWNKKAVTIPLEKEISDYGVMYHLLSLILFNG